MRLANIGDENTEPAIRKLFSDGLTQAITENSDLSVCELSTVFVK